ncbi:MAG: hypothetical protein DRO14_00990 [Thermoprotei archaeon]|nr:MAG: hypothetical protein DRO14_00990 [Thermoprotei archaeon]
MLRKLLCWCNSALNKRLHALVEALFVTFLWSTSYILIKIGLRELNPIAFAAYRYILASLILIILALTQYKGSRNLEFKQLLVFLMLGFSGYFVAQGLQFFWSILSSSNNSNVHSKYDANIRSNTKHFYS